MAVITICSDFGAPENKVSQSVLSYLLAKPLSGPSCYQELQRAEAR